LLRYKFNLWQYFFRRSDLFFWLYLLAISFNLLCAKDKRIALSLYKDLTMGAIFIYFLIKNEIDFYTSKKIFYVLCFCAGLVSFFGITEMLTRSNWIYKYYAKTPFYFRFIGYRMMSTLVHPNVLGSYLIVCVPLAYYFFKNRYILKIEFLNLATPIFMLTVFALALTFSRGTWIASLLMFSVWLWIKNKKKWILFIWLMLIFFCCFVQLAAKYGYLKGERFGIISLLRYISDSHRIRNYFTTFKILKQHPWVGIGLNHYRLLFNQYSSSSIEYELRVPESMYLEHLAETGIIGFLGLVILLTHTVRKAWLGYRKLADENKEMLLVIIMSFMGLLFNLAFYDGFLWNTPFYLFWILLAVLNSFDKQNRIKQV
jgi:O-antigen ligase